MGGVLLKLARAAWIARPVPKGGCAFPASNDNSALTRLRPTRGRHGLGVPTPIDMQRK